MNEKKKKKKITDKKSSRKRSSESEGDASLDVRVKFVDFVCSKHSLVVFAPVFPPRCTGLIISMIAIFKLLLIM
jgi:hypothetical protein